MKPCPVCNGVGMLRLDGTPGPFGGSFTMKEMLAGFKPCVFCKFGELVQDDFRKFNEEWSKLL